MTKPLRISLEQLLKCYPNTSKLRAALFVEPLNQTFQRFGADTPQRIRYFLAQIGHESGELRYTEEIASGRAYEGRLDLGNTQPGDGVRYKGRGLIQTTGKTNYVLVGLALNLPLLEKPELLADTEPSAFSAGFFFQNNNLWPLCDSGDFKELSYRINGRKKAVGGIVPNPNGWEDRLRLLALCEKHLPDSAF